MKTRLGRVDSCAGVFIPPFPSLPSWEKGKRAVDEEYIYIYLYKIKIREEDVYWRVKIFIPALSERLIRRDRISLKNNLCV